VLSKKIKVLLVEDQLLMQFAAKMCLVAANSEVEVADSGEKAIELASVNIYDIIFMDIGLDDIDGYEATKKIRLSSSQNSNTPVIALSSNTKEEYREKAKIVQMNDFIGKPLTAEIAKKMFQKYVKK
jgi:two-component system aerobic respiration control sensor histidine kinase ArcB